MWTREELKTRAKACLKKYYWAAFLVSLILAILTSMGSNGSNGAGNPGADPGFIAETPLTGNDPSGVISSLPESAQDIAGYAERLPVWGSGTAFNALKAGNLLVGVFTGIAVAAFIVSAVIGIFVVPVMTVGKNRFYMESRLKGASAGVGKLFWGFSGNYLNIVWTMFLRDIIIGLGFVCCVVPGFYFSYCYYMVPYILAENPEMKAVDALRLSKEMMHGHKFNTFVLGLSFIGWQLLGIICCGIGGFFVNPYIEATMAELYAVLRRPYSGTLAGFGMPDYGSYNSYGGYSGYNNGYDQNNGYSGYSNGYGQNSGYSGYNNGYGQNSQYNGYSQNNQSGGYAQGQYNDNNQSTGYGSHDPNCGWYQTDGNSDHHDENESKVDRSEGGPGRGYYLNGVFYPYEDNKKE